MSLLKKIQKCGIKLFLNDRLFSSQNPDPTLNQVNKQFAYTIKRILPNAWREKGLKGESVSRAAPGAAEHILLSSVYRPGAEAPLLSISQGHTSSDWTI